jgi:catechol 2,3-dioxygenase-like lactoylglutathione lyase family enzyme
MNLLHILGLHHVTAIAGDPQRNLNFYAGILGLRLVKLTVNFDDPTTYHLYYGDGLGTPGTILTFFPWPRAPRGQQGPGQVGVIALAIPPAGLDYWLRRLRQHDVASEGPVGRFDEQLISFRDPDGLRLELVAGPSSADRSGWQEGSVPAECAIRGVHTVALWEDEPAATDRFLTGTLGFRPVGEEGSVTRYAVGGGGSGMLVDVRRTNADHPGFVAVGTVHHVAWRTPDDAEQLRWREQLSASGVQVTPVRDRKYFHSIYFHEPGRVLFEIATDPPGFAVDERPEELGEHLQLPAWLEPQRAQLERVLPPLTLSGMQAHG